MTLIQQQYKGAEKLILYVVQLTGQVRGVLKKSNCVIKMYKREISSIYKTIFDAAIFKPSLRNI